MKKLNISTPKYKNTFTLLDNDDYEWAKKWKWQAQKSGDVLYAGRTQKTRKRKNRKIWLHREVARARSFEHVDHKSRDGLDNRKENLRLCSMMENQQNRKKAKGRSADSSQYKGVFRRVNKSGIVWYSFIHVNKKRIRLGTFNNEDTAAAAYDKAAIKYFGDFARLNNPGQSKT